MASKHRRVASPPDSWRRTALASAPPPPVAIEVTDGHTNLTHHVTDEAMAEGRRAGGRYQAICGARVLSASLATPVRRRCQTCAMWTSSLASAESPDLITARRLLDAAKRGGFNFQRVAPGPDGPLWGVRETLELRDTIYLAGFGQACTATRARKSSLIIPGGPMVTQRVSGDAVSVLHTVVCDWDP